MAGSRAAAPPPPPQRAQRPAPCASWCLQAWDAQIQQMGSEWDEEVRALAAERDAALAAAAAAAAAAPLGARASGPRCIPAPRERGSASL